MSAEPQVFLSLGANQGNCYKAFARARDEIAKLPGTRITGRSREKATAPVGMTDQPEFLNQVVRLETGLPPDELMDSLLAIERSMGRVRTERWGPRTIDIDILFYGNLRLLTPDLTIPHPELRSRPFFLEMVAEIESAFLCGWQEFSAPEGG